MKLDPKLNVKPVAFKVLTLLRRKLVRLPKELEKKILLAATAAWYNGRERGISLTLQPETYRGRNRDLIIVWSEARSSDSVAVWGWESDHLGINPPTFEDRSEEVYHKGLYFSPVDKGYIHTVADHIYKLIAGYLLQLEERPKEAI